MIRKFIVPTTKDENMQELIDNLHANWASEEGVHINLSSKQITIDVDPESINPDVWTWTQVLKGIEGMLHNYAMDYEVGY